MDSNETPPGEPTDLVASAQRIWDWWQKSAEGYVRSGKELNRVKEFTDDGRHGYFTKWIKARLPFSPRTAQYLMEIGRNPVLANPKNFSVLPACQQTLLTLARLPEAVVEQAIASGVVNPRMTHKEALALRPKKDKKPQDHTRKQQESAEQALRSFTAAVNRLKDLDPDVIDPERCSDWVRILEWARNVVDGICGEVRQLIPDEETVDAFDMEHLPAPREAAV